MPRPMFFLTFDLFFRAEGGRWRELGLCVAGGLLAPALVLAQDKVPTELLQLRNSAKLEESISPLTRSLLPSFVSGDTITGRSDLETVVQGHAMLRKADMVIKADRLEYNQPTDMAHARGNVHINRAGNVYEGPLLELRVDAFEGFFSTPTYHFLKNDSHGQADRVDFLDDQRAIIHNATFTTCKRDGRPDWLPAWILRASRISMDNAEDVGTAEGAVLSFKGVPLLPIPYVTFPLSDQRKSGLLPPSIGLSNVNGFEVSQPYYWNIAPNRDATITPTLMTKRGLNINTEFRYLEQDYSGTANVEWMPNDELRNTNRWSLNTSHHAQIDSDWTDNGLTLDLALNRVSDDNYWKDFTRTNLTTTQLLSVNDTALLASNSTLTQRLLANDARLAWTNGPFTSMFRVLKWQTLQDLTDTTAAIVPPYNRLPQLTTHYANTTESGLNLAMDVDYTRFESDSKLTGQPNGQRLFSLMQVSRSWRAPEGYITPKLQLHATQYEFDSPLSNGQSQASRVLPTFSLDTGLVFERETQIFGRSLTQTLEPRAFYVHTPYRDQSFLPNYDSGINDFNLSTIYTENTFVGNDRISDSNQMTLGVTSRLLDPDTGAEAARFGVAQRILFADQLVTLPGGTALTDRVSDLLLSGSVNWDPRWNFGGTVQYNPDNERTVRSTLNASYRPGSYRILNLAYRFQRDSSEQIDLSWQWPLADLWGSSQADGAGRWYSVGRLNYGVNESQMVNAVLGFEYDAGCWLGRVVFERLQTGTTSANQSIMFQLVFVGFTGLGVNPLQNLKNNIPGYQSLSQPAGVPSRFSNYD